MNRTLLMTSAVLCFLGVALGALGAHGVKTLLHDAPEEALRLGWWETAARYHLIHGLAIGLVSVLSAHVNSRVPQVAAALFVTGVVLFSGSLYVMALTGVHALGMVTPFGGLAFLSGWLCVVLAARRLSGAQPPVA